MTEVYRTSRIKRHRASKTEMEQRREALFQIVSSMQPMTVRQAFYQTTIRGVVEKTEAGYGKVQRMLAHLRRAGTIPFDWIADNTRWQRKPRTYSDPSEAVRQIAEFYRKDLWADADVHVEIWLEKDALAGVVNDVTSAFTVPLMVSRGYASLSFLHEAAEAMNHLGRTAHIYHFGDYDPSGQDAADKIEQDLRRYADSIDIHFHRVAVRPEQIVEWSLPTRPTKQSDSRAKGFADVSVELDAIDPDRLRGLVQSCIEQHLPQEQYRILKVAEASERELLHAWAGDWEAR